MWEVCDKTETWTVPRKLMRTWHRRMLRTPPQKMTLGPPKPSTTEEQVDDRHLTVQQSPKTLKFETKIQNKLWKHCGSTPLEKSKQAGSFTRVMASVFWSVLCIRIKTTESIKSKLQEATCGRSRLLWALLDQVHWCPGGLYKEWKAVLFL